MKQLFLRALPALSLVGFLGCGDNVSQSSRLRSFDVAIPFVVSVDGGGMNIIGSLPSTPRPLPRPVGDATTLGNKLGMQGDMALCAADSSLSTQQIAMVADIKRRLKNIITRLSGGVTTIMAGEKNTLRNTPACSTFEEEIVELARLLGVNAGSSSGDSGTTTPPAGAETSIANIDFEDEGHGWLVLKATLANGKEAAFHLGVKTRDAQTVLASQERVIETGITKQAAGLKFKLQNHDSDTDYSTSTESCSETRYQTVCRWDPATKQDVCRQESYTVYGTREVSLTTYTDDYLYTVEFLSGDLSTVHAKADMNTHVVRYSSSRGVCYVHDHGGGGHGGGGHGGGGYGGGGYGR